jgi:hypothetical protein
MALVISKKIRTVLFVVLGVLVLGGGGFLIWRINQPDTVAPEDSLADYDGDCQISGSCYYVTENGEQVCVGTCWNGDDWRYCNTCNVEEPPEDPDVGYTCKCGEDEIYCEDCNDWDDCIDKYGPCGCTGWGDSHPCDCNDGYCYVGIEDDPNSPGYCPADCVSPCECGYFTYDKTGDGKNSCGVSPCEEGELKWTRTCTPSGCDVEHQCIADSLCTPETCTPGCGSCSSGNYYENPSSDYVKVGTRTCTNTDCSTYTQDCYSPPPEDECADCDWVNMGCNPIQGCTALNQPSQCGSGTMCQMYSCDSSSCPGYGDYQCVSSYMCSGDEDPEECISCSCDTANGWFDACAGPDCYTKLSTCIPSGCEPQFGQQITCYKVKTVIEDTCGNGVCDGDDTLQNCPQDCWDCGDGNCTSPFENATSCPQDCTECGDGLCTNGETAHDCPQDCDAVCPDGYCTHDENPSTCPLDCSAVCPDGYCTHSETALSCPADCDSECGDGSCTHDETAVSCPEDCDPDCGDGACTGDENAFTCPNDCDAECGDGFCTHSENANTCPADCDAVCGDGYCTGDETASSCPSDCDATCGDGACTHDETVNSCPEDCDASCGDGYCTGDENQTNCPIDCGTASGPTPQTGIFDTVVSRLSLGLFFIILGSIVSQYSKINYLYNSISEKSEFRKNIRKQKRAKMLRDKLEDKFK